MPHYSAKQSQALATKPISQLLWSFAVPSIIATSANSLYYFCDTIFVGNHSGFYAIAGMAITFPLTNIITAFGTLARVGATTQASIYMGRNMQRAVHEVLGNGLFLNISFAVLLTLLGISFLEPLLSFFGASPVTMPYAKPYMYFLLLGTLPNFIFQLLCNMIRSTGHPSYAMYTQLLAVILNVLLDGLFIFVLDMGIKGAALGTIVAQLLAMFFLLPYFFNKKNYLFFSKSIFNISADHIRDILGVGVSPFLSNLSGCLIVTLVLLSLLFYGGDMYISAYGITHRITQLLIMMVVGFSQGLQPIVGYNMGAGAFRRVRQAVHQSILIVTVLATIGYTLIALFPGFLVRLFVSEYEFFDICIPALRISLFTLPLVGSQLVAVAFFQSIRKAKLSAFISLSRQLCCLLPLLLILPDSIGVTGVWWSMSLSDFFSVVLSWILLNRMLKRLESIHFRRRRS